MKIVFPIGIPTFLDIICYEIMAIIVGSFKIAAQTAAHVAFCNYIGLFYSIPFGIGGAICTIASNRIG